MRSPIYVRLIASPSREPKPRALGIFQAAGDLEWGVAPQPILGGDAERLRDLLGWFNRQLPFPRDMRGSAVCWYKPEAREFIARSFELAALLGRHGYGVGLVRTTRPGAVVYEDAWQVAAIPFRDTWSVLVGHRVRPVRRLAWRGSRPSPSYRGRGSPHETPGLGPVACALSAYGARRALARTSRAPRRSTRWPSAWRSLRCRAVPPGYFSLRTPPALRVRHQGVTRRAPAARASSAACAAIQAKIPVVRGHAKSAR